MLRNLKLFVQKNIAKLRSWVIGEHVEGLVCSTEHGVFIINKEDLAVGKKLAYRGTIPTLTEYEVLSNLISKIDNPSLCVIGAHIGTLLIPLARHAKNAVGYEANPSTYNILKQNLKLNESDNITIYNYAVGDESREVEFYASSVNTGGSKIKPESDKYMYDYDNPEKLTIDMISLDEHKDNTDKFDLITMDIEGSEYYALKGMQETLKECRYLELEYLPHHLENVVNVSNEEFLSVFGEFFREAKVIDPPNELKTGRIYDNSNFLGLLDTLRETRNSANLLFSSEPELEKLEKIRKN